MTPPAQYFGYSIWLADAFEDVLDRASAKTAPLDIGAFSELVQRTACTLLQARGGAGKTYIANGVCNLLRGRGVWAAVVPALSIRGDEPLADVMNENDDSPGLIVIDGLNEVDRPTGERILDTIGPFTATNPHISFLVTDRLTRRPNASPFWKHATLGPVPDDVIRTIAETEPTEALSIPFYLERHSSGSAAHQILAESISRYVADEQLPLLGEAAYMSYQKHNRRALDRDITIAALGQETWQTLLDAKAVEATGGQVLDFHFEHHLLHDFLAARHLATNDQLWHGDGFDVVTLKASSFDALALALTQVRTDDAVEDLVQRIYDWNFYAAAYMLEEDRGGDRRISDALRIALLGALAEKRFDDVVPTVVRVEDALRVQQSPLAAELLTATDRDDIVRTLTGQLPTRPPTWFAVWLDQYAREDGASASEADVEKITSAQPVVGWGAANALRRMTLPQESHAELRRLLAEHESATVRWRAAHALGTHPSEENLRSLRAALTREPPISWVAYGALRAEFEQVRRTPTKRRPDLLAEIATETSDLIAIRGVLRAEAIRSLDVNPLPDNWHRDIEPLLVHLWETADARGAAELAALAQRLRQRKETPTDVA